MARGADIEERLIEFTVRIIPVCDAFFNKLAERQMRGQFISASIQTARQGMPR